MRNATRRTELVVKTARSRTRVRSWLDLAAVLNLFTISDELRSCLFWRFRLSSIFDTRGSRTRESSGEYAPGGRGGGGKKKRSTHAYTRNSDLDRFDTGDKALPDFGPVRRTVEMLKQLQMGMRAFLLMASRVWTCICFLLKKQVRAVSRCFAPLFAPSSAVRHESYYEPSNRRLADPFPHLVLLSRYRYWQIVDVTLPESVIRPLPCECSFAISFETKRDETWKLSEKLFYKTNDFSTYTYTFLNFFSIDFTRLCKSYIPWKMIFILFTKRTQFFHVLL